VTPGLACGPCFFGNISSILSGISKSSETIKRKIDTLKTQLNSIDISVEEHADFIGPFLDFSAEFASNVGQFERLIYSYRDIREREARYAHMFRIAKDARQRLKDRFTGAGNAESDAENEIREKVIHTFDYGETETNLQYAQREAKNTLTEIETLLEIFREMCQFAKNPAMREKENSYQPFRESRYVDVFTLFTQAQAKYPRVEMIREPILELFRLYQHSYGLFGLDFHKFNQAILPMTENAEAYFHAKDEDADIRTKRIKLEKIEGLIEFLEHATLLLKHLHDDDYANFSKGLTSVIAKPASGWIHISEDLLHMKVAAEADLSTRIG
jgi:hypothetical protein